MAAITDMQQRALTVRVANLEAQVKALRELVSYLAECTLPKHGGAARALTDKDVDRAQELHAKISPVAKSDTKPLDKPV